MNLFLLPINGFQNVFCCEIWFKIWKKLSRDTSVDVLPAFCVIWRPPPPYSVSYDLNGLWMLLMLTTFLDASLLSILWRPLPPFGNPGEAWQEGWKEGQYFSIIVFCKGKWAVFS